MIFKISICVERDLRAGIGAFRVTYLHNQSPTANPTGIEGSRTYIALEPPPFGLVGKHTSTAVGAGSWVQGSSRR